MNQWSTNRKRIILILVIFVLVVLIGAPIYFFFHKAPTCFDKIKNGDETGVDCGGSCELVCTTETLPLLLKGDPQILRVATSTYEVALLIQNPNVSAEILRAPFTISLYSANSPLPLKTIGEETFVPKNSSFGIFEGPFNFPGDVPTRATFTWAENALMWQKDLTPTPDLKISDEALSKTDSEPRLEATITNPNLVSVMNIELVAFILDENGNMVGASKTFVDNLDAGQSAPLIFTWPAPFQGNPATFQIIPRILPNKSYLK
jgi:hypothetical protein